MCAENANADSRTNRSPFCREKLPSVIHKMYNPATASATAAQILIPAFFPKKILNIGTSTMYIAVINPALPTVVYCIPICCRLPATKSMTPQQIPPSSRFFRLPGVFPASSSFAPVL